MLGSLNVAVTEEKCSGFSKTAEHILYACYSVNSTFITKRYSLFCEVFLRCLNLIVGLSGHHVHIWVCCVQILPTEEPLRSHHLYCWSSSFILDKANPGNVQDLTLD